MVSVVIGSLDFHPPIQYGGIPLASCLGGFKRGPMENQELLIRGSNKATPRRSVRSSKEAFLPLLVREIAVEDSGEPELPRVHSSNDHTHAPPLWPQQGSIRLPPWCCVRRSLLIEKI